MLNYVLRCVLKLQITPSFRNNNNLRNTTKQKRWQWLTVSLSWKMVFVQQIGTPQEVYSTPNNVFVAGFIGSPAMNFFKVTLNDGVISNGKGLSLQLPEAKKNFLKTKVTTERINLRYPSRRYRKINRYRYLSIGNSEVEVVVSELLGAETMLYTRVDDTEFVSKVDARDFHNPGRNSWISIRLKQISLLRRRNWGSYSLRINYRNYKKLTTPMSRQFFHLYIYLFSLLLETIQNDIQRTSR